MYIYILFLKFVKSSNHHHYRISIKQTFLKKCGFYFFIFVYHQRIALLFYQISFAGQNFRHSQILLVTLVQRKGSLKIFFWIFFLYRTKSIKGIL